MARCWLAERASVRGLVAGTVAGAGPGPRLTSSRTNWWVCRSGQVSRRRASFSSVPCSSQCTSYHNMETTWSQLRAGPDRWLGHCTLSYRIFLISWNSELVEKGGWPTSSS